MQFFSAASEGTAGDEMGESIFAFPRLLHFAAEVCEHASDCADFLSTDCLSTTGDGKIGGIITREKNQEKEETGRGKIRGMRAKTMEESASHETRLASACDCAANTSSIQALIRTFGFAASSLTSSPSHLS